jgi:hypothetical protein
LSTAASSFSARCAAACGSLGAARLRERDRRPDAGAAQMQPVLRDLVDLRHRRRLEIVEQPARQRSSACRS